MWRRLSGFFYSSDSPEQARSTSPRPALTRNHHSSRRTRGSPQRQQTPAPIPENPERSESPGNSATASTGGMPPERHGSTNRRQIAATSEVGKRKGSFNDRFRSKHNDKQPKTNTHEIWMDGAKNDSGEREKGKQKEREVYPGRDDLGSTRNKSQELLDAFKPSARSSKSTTIKTLLAEKQSLTEQVQTLQTQLQSASEREQNAQSRIQVLEQQVRVLERKSNQDDEEIQSLLKTSTRSAEAASRHIRDLEQRSQGLDEQVRKLRERAHKAEAAAAIQAQQAANASMPTRAPNQAQEVQLLTPERRAEEVFKSKADSYAGAEIIRMVQSLNAEILQCAAFIAESVMAADIKASEDARTLEKCRKRTVERVGQRLVLAMRRTVDTGERDPLPLQLALQHAIIVWSCYIVQAFTPENRELNGQLTGIWGKISMREEPAVAGKWRSILASQLRGPTTMYRAIYDECRYIMVAGGWSTKAPNSATIAANVQARLMGIEASIMKLKEAVIEGVTSTEVVPNMLPESHPYDPTEMDSAYPDPTDPDMVKKPIICTTDMGVRRLVIAQPGGGRTLSRSWETLLKPKVILPSALDDEVDG